MKNDAQKNILFLAVAGLVFIAVNVAVLMAAQSGQLAPVDNLTLWGAFAVLNVCSLLWAVSLLGLQPLVVAFSYVAGGFLAYQGVRLLPNANMVEATTAGATYGAFGVMVVGNAATRVRLAFFNKAQVPFVFVMVALLVVDGFINSQVSASGWSVILGAMVVPFVFSGLVIGAVWMVLARFGVVKESTWRQTEEVAGIQAEPIPDAEGAKLVIKMPESAKMADIAEEVAAVAKAVEPAPAPKVVPAVPEAVEAPVASVSLESESVEEESKDFFPLEIDKGEDVAPPQEEAPSLVIVEPPVAEAAPEPEEEPVAGSQDWLNNQLDLLNNLKKKAS